MMIDHKYKSQVDLLLQTIPYVAKEKIFALKGGTAINLFLRNMPRLSIDIDLTYLPIDDRETALKQVQSKLTDSDRQFLMSFKEGNPDWEKLSAKNARELPAVQWKLQNILKLKHNNPKKHKEMVAALEKRLFA